MTLAAQDRLQARRFAHSRLRITAPPARRSGLQWRNPAWLCVLASIALCLLGVYAMNITGGVEGPLIGYYARRQILWLAVALGACAVVATPHYRWIMHAAPFLAAITIGALVILLLPFTPESIVTPRNGARRWISLGFVDFQPSEIAKAVYVLALARYLRYRRSYRTLFGLIPPALITFVPMGLVLVEPNLGTALMFVPALFAMLIAAGAKLKHLVLVVLVAAAAAPTMYPLLQPHQKERIVGLLNQFTGEAQKSHKADSVNYQGLKAQTLIGAGGAAGMPGPVSRAYVQYNALPEDHNDMIFAVLVNRFGLLGGLFTMALYLVWLAGATLTAAFCKDPFGRLVCVGIAAVIAAQVVVNIGMNVGVLPITGLALPFVSYGGTSLLALFAMTGLILNIALRRPHRLDRASFEFDGEGE